MSFRSHGRPSPPQWSPNRLSDFRWDSISPNHDGTSGSERSAFMHGKFMQSGKPFDIATCMWYTGIDPISGKEVRVARQMRDRKLQRALMQFFKAENYFAVREALIEAGRSDLVGGCQGLIPAQPPKEAIETRRRQANRAVGEGEDGDHYHTVANPARGEKAGERAAGPATGYRPGRKTQKRRKRKSGPSA